MVPTPNQHNAHASHSLALHPGRPLLLPRRSSDKHSSGNQLKLRKPLLEHANKEQDANSHSPSDAVTPNFTSRDLRNLRAPPSVALPSLPSLPPTTPEVDTTTSSENESTGHGDDRTAFECYSVEKEVQPEARTFDGQHPYSNISNFRPVNRKKSATPTQHVGSNQEPSVFEYSPPSSRPESPVTNTSQGSPVSTPFKRFWRKGLTDKSAFKAQSRQELGRTTSNQLSLKVRDNEKEYIVKEARAATPNKLFKRLKPFNSNSSQPNAEQKQVEHRSPYIQHWQPARKAELTSKDHCHTSSGRLSEFPDQEHQASSFSHCDLLASSKAPSVRSRTVSDSVEASSQHDESVWTTSQTSLGSHRATVGRQAIEEASHESSFDLAPLSTNLVAEKKARHQSVGPLLLSPGGKQNTGSIPSLRSIPDPPQAVAPQPLGRILGLRIGELSDLQELQTPPARISPGKTKSFDMSGSAKGGWRSRFGGKKSGGEDAPPSLASALTEHFNTEKGPSTDYAKEAKNNEKQSDREIATQHPARQQHSNNVSRLAHTQSAYDVQQPAGLVTAPSPTSPFGRVEDYKRAARIDMVASTNASKLERMTGEQGLSSTRQSRSTYDASSLSGARTGGTRSYTGSEAGQHADASCPVCLELLSYRLAGEKAHIVPMCGHALHHACFSAVYGSPDSVLAAQMSSGGNKSLSPGMCGVCRRLIVLDEEKQSTRVVKAAGVMGVETTNDEAYDGSGSELDVLAHDDSLDDGSISARTREKRLAQQDDSHFNNSSSKLTSNLEFDFDRLGIARQQNNSRSMVLPTITIRPEYETIYLKNHPGMLVDQADSGAQPGPKNVVCVISISIPSRRPVPLFAQDVENRQNDEKDQYGQRLGTSPKAVDHKWHEDDVANGDRGDTDAAETSVPNGVSYPTDSHFEASNAFRGDRPHKRTVPSHSVGVANAGTEDESSAVVADDDDEGFSFSATPAVEKAQDYSHVVEDLRNRIIDWKGHTIERFGSLVLYEYLGVRQDAVVRDFFVYLFKEALLCVNEEKRKDKSFTRLISADRSQGSDDHTLSGSGSSTRKSKVPLKLKGRIWLRHIRHCTETEIDGNPCVSIKLDDESLDQFVLCFRDAALRSAWRVKLSNLLQETQTAKKQRQNVKVLQRLEGGPQGVSSPPERPTTSAIVAPPVAFPGMVRAKQELERQRLNVKNGIATDTPSPARPQPQSNRVPISSPVSMTDKKEQMEGNGHGKNHSNNSPPLTHSGVNATSHVSLPRHQQWSASGGLDPKAPLPQMTDHTAMDLVIIVSVPSTIAASLPGHPSSTLSSSAALKLRLIQSTLNFTVANMGPRDRIALVSYQVGENGLVRRTALLNSAKSGSLSKLEQFIGSTGLPWEGPDEDPFREDVDERGGQSDRTDTVSAINVGFDIVLQRKSKNPVTAMLLINDTTDAPKRSQMDLIMARSEAANVPVHCFGFGKGHDPSSLWLVSNHTRGSYTFVKEWYQLRECVAGCIGSLMSVALTNVRLHVSLPSDNHFRARKVSGCTGTVISAGGKDVDLELGEMRFGECRELFVELELDVVNHVLQRSMHQQRNPTSALALQFEKGSATDDFMKRLGLEGFGLSASGKGDGRGHLHRGYVNWDRRQRGFVDDTVDDQWGPSEQKNDSDDEGDAAQRTATGYVEEVAVMEVQCGCRDPAMGTSISRLPDASMLTVEVDTTSRDPTVNGNFTSGFAATKADPVVTRRRLEILVSDMITRCLLLVSRRNHHQALTLLLETRRIVDTVLQGLRPNRDSAKVTAAAINIDGGGSGEQRHQSINDHRHASAFATTPVSDMPFSATTPMTSYTRSSKAHKQRERLQHQAIASLSAIMEDLDVLIDGLEAEKTVAFERSERNFGAQQAMVLRDQKAWTSRTDTEWQFFNRIDNGSVFAALAARSAAEFSR